MPKKLSTLDQLKKSNQRKKLDKFEKFDKSNGMGIVQRWQVGREPDSEKSNKTSKRSRPLCFVVGTIRQTEDKRLHRTSEHTSQTFLFPLSRSFPLCGAATRCKQTYSAGQLHAVQMQQRIVADAPIRLSSTHNRLLTYYYLWSVDFNRKKGSGTAWPGKHLPMSALEQVSR